jgi:hypothetical protein
MQDDTPDDVEPNEPVLTRRPVSTGAEAHLGVVHPMLDHGMIRLVDYMVVIDSARNPVTARAPRANPRIVLVIRTR